MKRILSFLLVMVLLLSVSATAFAVIPTDGVIGEATFNNVPNYTPDLYIIKKVSCDIPNTEIPDAEFTFTVTVAGSPYGDKAYTLYDLAGNEIQPPKDAQGNQLSSFKTNPYGELTIKANQMAKFEYVGRKAFTVTEGTLPADSDGSFEYDDPATGEVSGTVENMGTTVTIKNKYVPTPPPPPPGMSFGTLKVTKSISWPMGSYTTPDGAEPEVFSFLLELPNAAEDAAEAEYYIEGDEDTVYNAEDGVFTLSAGQTAVFSKLPAETDYKVSELTKDGWTLVKATNTEGAVKGGTVSFVNTAASFIVKKTVKGDCPDGQKFTFQLLDSTKGAWAGAKYWLYTSGGERVDNEEYTTDASGYFKLERNQAALFVGIAPGSTYTVKEIPTPGFEQITPTTTEGYTANVTAGGNAEHSFENKALDPEGTLTVTKLLEYDMDAPIDTPSFDFIIEKKTGDSYAPIKTTYHLPGSTANITVGTDGKFTLKANDTAYFDRLTTGDYRVSEVTSGMAAGYSVTPGYDAAQDVHLTIDGAALEFSNTYVAKKIDLVLYKYETDGRASQALKGAEFGIYTDIDCTHSFREVLNEDGVSVPETYVTGADGRIKLTDLRSGTFYIKEENAPKGYAVIPGTVIVKIERVLENGVETYKATATSNLESAEFSAGGVKLVNGKHTLTLNVGDKVQHVYTLPRTGGSGPIMFTIVGIALMLSMVVLFVFDIRKDRKNKTN